MRTVETERGRPNDEREFVHRRILGGISAISGILPIPGAATVSRITGALAGSRAPRQKPSVIPQTFEQTIPVATAFPGRPLNLGGNGDCPGTLRRNPKTGNCIEPTSPRGAEVFLGEAVVGRFGAAIVPGSVIRDIATCGRGMVLGKDGLCYDHLPNRDRLYPRGRRPLLTGGDMKAISRARRAGNRLATAKSDLVAIGMLKPAAPRRRKKKSVPCA